MNLSILSLIVLAIVVAIGFIKKVNLGFLSLGVAFLLGTAGGMSAKEITSGFSSSMFVTLVGVTFFLNLWVTADLVRTCFYLHCFLVFCLPWWFTFSTKAIK